MEQYPKTVEDKDLGDFVEFARRNAMGNIVTATDTPTNDTVKANTLVYYNDELYFKTNKGLTFKFSVTAVS